MAKTLAKLDQALQDLFTAYNEIELELNEKFTDEEEVANGLIEILETSIDSAMDDTDTTSNVVAMILSNMSDALEQIDPAAFEGGEDEEEDEDEEEYEIDDVDDLEEDEEFEEEDEDDDY